jgi:two-component system phosphate regulon sensor histidine kinase PhoR
MYKKICTYLRAISFAVILIMTAIELCVCYTYFENQTVFYAVSAVIVILSVLIYFLASIASSYLAESIVKPVIEADPYDKEQLKYAYEEIRPLLARISRQSTEINRQIDKVTEQKARLQTIMDNINEGLVIIDENHDVLTINTPALAILDAEEADVKHKKYSNLTDNKQLLNVIQKALSGEKSDIIFEAKERMYQIFYSPVKEKGEITGAVLLLFDVTERTKSEKIRREFTANVSHELKTPLTTIHGYAQIIDKGIAKPDDVRGFASKIEKESSRLIALVNDIIELSHLDENKADEPKEYVSLKPLAAEIADRLTPKAMERDIKILLTGTDTVVLANLSQITELLYNLVDNAVKYNKAGGSVTITVGEGMIEIEDTGIGIPEKYHDRIFERFFRVDKSHSKTVNGTGLGLSIVKHLAKINDAEIKIKSVVGEGSTFTVVFK